MNETANTTETSGRWQTFGCVLVFWAGYALLLIGSGMLSGMLPKHLQQVLHSWQLIVFGPVTSLGALALTVLLVRIEKISLEDVGVAIQRRSPVRFIIGFLIGLSLVALNTAMVSVTAGLRWMWVPEASFAAVMLTLVGFLAGSCGEELGFRGYPLRRLNRIFGLWTAQTIVAAAFAVYHLWVGWSWMSAVIGTTAGSLLFGMATIASRGLALPIGLHAAWNFGEWAVGAKGSPGLWKGVPESQRSSGVSVMVSYIVVAGLGILAFWLWHRRNLTRALVT